MKPSSLSIIARFTWLEARYGHLLWIALLMSVLLLISGWFLQAISVIELDLNAVSIMAPVARLVAIAIIGVFVISGTCRTLEQRGLDMILSAPVSRSQWLLGRLTGLMLAAIVIAIFAGLPLTLFASPLRVAQWTLSLAGELVMVAALGLMLSVSLTRLPAALLGLFSVYLCARTIGVISLLNASGIPSTISDKADVVAGTDLLSTLSDAVVTSLSVLLPRLDLMAQTQWLSEPVIDQMLLPIGSGLVQAAIYVAISVSVGVIDFDHRDV
ncbi:MAG: hypothetical protein WA888_10935 [Burkholderiaceae bacterium]